MGWFVEENIMSINEYFDDIILDVVGGKNNRNERISYKYSESRFEKIKKIKNK